MLVAGIGIFTSSKLFKNKQANKNNKQIKHIATPFPFPPSLSYCQQLEYKKEERQELKKKINNENWGEERKS